MKDCKLVEDGELSGTRILSDGYMVAQVRCARTGIQSYSRQELNLPGSGVVRVNRPESEVFSTDSMSSYANRPATNNHPIAPVTARTWKKDSVGSMGSDVLRDGDHVSVSLMLMDQAAIDDVQSGKRELSMGYTMDIEMGEGVTDAGEEYDATMRNLKMNHVALVNRGRAGSTVRIGDSWSPSTNDEEPQKMVLKNIVVDGLTVETTDAAEKAIVKLQGQIATADAALEKAKVEHEVDIDAFKMTQANTVAEHETAMATAAATNDSVLAAKDTELATKDAEIAELKKQIVTGDALDKLVADRQVFISKAKMFTGDADLSGKTDVEIKTMAIRAVNGADFATDKSPVYIDAAFDMLKAPEVKDDPVRKALMTGDVKKPEGDNGYALSVTTLNDEWKGAA